MVQVLGTVESRAGELTVARARLEDIPAVIDIQAEAADWLLRRGIDQWHIDRAQTAAHLRAAMTGYPPAREVVLAWHRPADHSAADGETALRGLAEQRASYAGPADDDLARQGLADGQAGPIATFSLQTADPLMWGERPDDALYLHSFAVRRAYAGLGVGVALLRWAEGYAAAAGKTYLRLDCTAENPALRAYYERAGFSYRGDVHGKTWSASLYEKRVRGTDEVTSA